MIDVVYYLFNSLGISSQPGRSRLSKWVKVSKEKFNEILSTITKAKNKELRTNIDGKEITLDSTEKLLKDLGNGILLDEREFKNRYNDIAYDAEVIVNKSPLTRNQAKIIDIILLLKKIWSDKQPNTTDISGLKSEESDEQNKQKTGQELNIQTPDQMLRRLPITLAQLKAGNISQKPINEIRQLLHSLYRSKKLTKTI